MKRYPDSSLDMCRRALKPPVLVLLLAAGFAGHAQQRMPKFAAGDLPCAALEKETAYEGKALYGYIDGGAEIFLEYGFRRAIVQDIAAESLRVHLDIFEMTSPEAAVGIFSASSQGCPEDGDLWDFTCATRFHVQGARGRYFVRAANMSPAPEEKGLSEKVFSLVASKIVDSMYAPPAVFLDSLFRAGRRTFLVACGPLGVENGLDEWRNLLEGFGTYRLEVLVQESEGRTTRTALLEFAPEGRDSIAFARWEENAPPATRRFTVADGPDRLMLCETNSDGKTAEKYRATMERYRRNWRP